MLRSSQPLTLEISGACLRASRRQLDLQSQSALYLKTSTGETIIDKSQLKLYWAEHYSELHGGTNFVSPSTLDKIERLPTLLELDDVPTKEELSKAIMEISSGKAPGQVGVPAEVLKCGGSQLFHVLHQLLCRCWEEGSVPQEMRDSTIISLYKHKGDRSDRNNYRGISLLCIAGKLLARVALHRLQQLAERVFPESQRGFRSKRSTVDMMFSLRDDETENINSLLVSRVGLFKILPLIGCPPKLLSFIKSFHDGTRGTVHCALCRRKQLRETRLWTGFF